MKSVTDIAILGAGVAGLSTAYHLKRDYQIYERSENTGGLCGSDIIDGFTFDHGPHLYFSTDTYVVSLLKKLLKYNLLENQSRPGQYYRGVVVPYPYTVNLHGLPQEIIESCIAGFREAADLRHGAPEPKTYAEWCHYHYGRGFAENFMLPYAKNYWAVDPQMLNTEWIGNKIYVPTLDQIEAGARGERGENFYYYNTYRYPRHGGAGALPEAFLHHVQEPLTGKQAETIDLATKTIFFSDGSEVDYDSLVSTLPVPNLVKLIKDAPQDIGRAAENLLCNSVACVLIGLAKSRKSDYSWIYFSESDVCFYRVCFPEHFSPDNVPEGKSGMWVEVSYSAFKPIDKENIIDNVITDLNKVGLLNEEDNIQTTGVHDLKNAYVIYDKQRKHSLDMIHSYLGAHDVFSCGRFGEWAHMWSHEVILSTKALAEKLNMIPARVQSNHSTADNNRFVDNADNLLLPEDG